MRNKFRDQQCGVFEKSLRCGSVTGENLRKGQWTEGPWRNKNTDLKVGTELREQGEGICERKHGVFYTYKIKKIMDEILQEKLSNQSYDSQRCPWLCMSLSEDIKGRVKELGMERFRLICNVSIGSNNGQGFFMASRFLWNEFRDNFSSSSFQNASLFAVAVVFGVLQEWALEEEKSTAGERLSLDYTWWHRCKNIVGIESCIKTKYHRQRLIVYTLSKISGWKWKYSEQAIFFSN